MSPSNMARIFSYAFTTAGRAADEDEDECGGGPYAAQHVGGIATVGAGGGSGEANVFGEITGKGLQTGLGTIAGLGYGLPMSRLYARLAYMLSLIAFLPNLMLDRYFGGSLDLLSLEGWGRLNELSCDMVTDPCVGSDVFLKLRCLDEAVDSTI